jgi:hypothetical protein
LLTQAGKPCGRYGVFTPLIVPQYNNKTFAPELLRQMDAFKIL